MSNLTGRALGVYQVEKKIGEGGNSDVYLARDTRNNERVALKLLRLEHHADPKKVERFWQSGHAARHLQHRHIVRVREAGMADARYYIAMDYMSGRSVEDVLNQGEKALHWKAALHYIEQVAEAIDYAHTQGVIHRDIKPSNILLSEDRKTAYLTDFGIALLTGRETSTHSGTLVGTPEYISPEQIQGRTADRRSDIYSLGVTAYHMLSGRLPFDGPAVTVLYNHVHTPPPAIGRINRELPAGFNRAINRALAKDPQRRYATAGEFARELRRAATGKPNRMVWAGLGAVVALILLLAVVPRLLNQNPATTTVVTRQVTATAGAIVDGPTATVAATIAGATAVGATSTTAAIAPATSTGRPPATDPPPTLAAAGNTPTRPPAPDRAAPRPLAPADGADLARNAAIQTFRWEWARPLAADESYELRFYGATGDDFAAPFGWHKQSSAEVDLNNLPAGTYRWAVAVVRGVDGAWAGDVAESEKLDLTWGR
ncbi:putative Mitogen-activated protein kinase kinase kinase [Candidatus Promineifilum breve]|uniref:non-specific serine/threonine protein kinase n=1 Tax=Candidatus Promineifilum breve TaxID=1806508 RepID=A0A160T5S9_9CHLR|nr:serine/threonine-protein kinase [Candidatus Promineifilum breve]CUS05731.1 putative Mitogen-activated protein kinase kinase kinase [Candidatus Promineifilum breve]